MHGLQKKYGIWTATAMVIGIVIGSGVFFKADDVLAASGGSLPIALLAWLIGGLLNGQTISSFTTAAKTVSTGGQDWPLPPWPPLLLMKDGSSPPLLMPN